MANNANLVIGYARPGGGGVGQCSRSSHTAVYAPVAARWPHPPPNRSLRFLPLCIEQFCYPLSSKEKIMFKKCLLNAAALLMIVVSGPGFAQTQSEADAQ